MKPRKPNKKLINLLIIASILIIILKLAAALPYQSHPGEQITGEITEAELSCDKMLQSDITDDTDFCVDVDTRCDNTFPCTTLCLNGICISSFSELNQSIDIDALGPSITGTCADGFIREIQENGTITCEKVTTDDLDFDPGAMADYCAGGTCAGDLYTPGNIKLDHGQMLTFKHSSGSDSSPTSGIISGIVSPNSIGIYASGTTSLLVDTDGKVRIGDIGTAPAHVLGVKTSAGHAVVDISSPTAQISAIDFMEGVAARWGIGKNANNEFFIDESGVGNAMTIKPGGNVGIGTTSPTEKLDVDGNIIASGSICDGYGCISWMPTGSDIYFDTGNVGIGTADPDSKLDVVGTIKQNGNQVCDNSNNCGYLTSFTEADPYIDAMAADKWCRGTGAQVTCDQNPYWTKIGDSVYKETGNVGIGTTNPTANLHIVDGSMPMVVVTRGSASSTFGQAGYGGFLELYDVAGTQQVLIRGGADSFIKGDLGIGTTSPRAKLEVNGNIRYKAAGNSVEMTNTPGYLEYTINGVAYGVTIWVSSERFKENIKDLEIDSSKIYDLRPVSFQWELERGGDEDFGLIAEEVEKVEPMLIEYDKEGKPFFVRYDVLSVLLLNELKKKATEIDDLKEAVKQLKERVEELE